MSDLIENPFEIWQTPDGGATFYFSYSDKNLTTGVLLLQPGSSLPKHNRPGGCENLVQLSGQCEMTVFSVEDEGRIEKSVELSVDEQLRMSKGQWHIHANSSGEPSLTFFKLVGDITEIMGVLRKTNLQIEPKDMG